MELIDRIAAQPDMAHRTRRVIANTCITVHADDRLVTDCFDDYMPTIGATPLATAAEYDIFYVCDEALEREIRALALQQEAESYWIKVDVCFLRLQRDGCTFYVSDVDDVTRQDYAIVGRGRQFWVVCSRLSEMLSRVSVRLFREILLRQLENIGGCFAHAAAVSRRGGSNGLLVFGDSGAGKSTTVWQLCQTGDFDYVSNDKSIVVRHEGQVRVVCWPLAIRLGTGALHSSGKLAAYREKGQSREQDSSLWTQPVDSEEQRRSNWGNKVKLSLTPRELSSYEGIQSRADCTLVGVIIPRLRLGDGELQITEVEFSSHRDIMERNILEPWDEDIGRGWLGIRTVTDAFLEDSKAALLDTLSRMPVYELSGDPQSFDGALERIAAAVSARC